MYNCTGYCTYCAHIRFYNLYTDERVIVRRTREDKVLTIALRNCTLPDDGPVRHEMYSTLCLLKDCRVFFKQSVTFCWFTL